MYRTKWMTIIFLLEVTSKHFIKASQPNVDFLYNLCHSNLLCSVADKIIIDCKVAFQLIKQFPDDKIYPSSDFHLSKLFVKPE